MASLLDKLSSYYDYYSNRFVSGVAAPHEIEQCLALRKRVFADELHRIDTQGSASPADKDFVDDVSVHFVCYDTQSDELVGAIRMTRAHYFLEHEKYRNEYQLDLLPKELLEDVYVISRLVIEKKYRKTPASLTIFQACYEHALQHNILFGLLVCEPNLYPLYKSLGFRPLSPVGHSPFGGYRIPLYMVLHNYEYLKKCRSPLYSVAKRLEKPVLPQGLAWEQVSQHTSKFLNLGYSLIDSNDVLEAKLLLLQGVSEEGKNQLFKNAVRIKCQYGDRILSEESGGRGFGLILQGGIQVQLGQDKILLLGAGEIFGELSFILDVSRTAKLIATSDDTEVVFVSPNAFDKVKDINDQKILWQNMAAILACRIINTNRV